ncbi:MAG: prenyltransferase [Cyanobacteria bacterium SIG31]|nr:prenyltransferase [Cyanobacteria bacterium SIG31]
MISKTKNILECSRIFSLPMTILSWLIIFTFSVINSGNIVYGLIALAGICLVHLGANVTDDYFDYKSLIKRVDFNKEEYLKNSQKTKCRYLISGLLSEKQVLGTIFVYYTLALCCGFYLYLKCGIGVFYFAFIGAVISISYPFISRICLSEIAVAVAYGPALFGGVYYVMNGIYSWEVFMLSIPSMLMTVILLYIHTIMDYEFDLNEGKKTLANIFSSQLESLIVLKILLVLAYSSLILLCVYDILDWQVFLVYITIPLGVDLYRSMKQYAFYSEGLPPKKWYHFPMENIEKYKKNNEAPFMIRMLQARNLMIYFSLVLVATIIICLAL